MKEGLKVKEESEIQATKEIENKGYHKRMNVLNLSIELSRLDPMLDSKQYEEDGVLYRNVLVEVRSGEESVIRINESVEGEYELLGKFSKLGEEISKNLIDIIENYCWTPVEVRLAK